MSAAFDFLRFHWVRLLRAHPVGMSTCGSAAFILLLTVAALDLGARHLADRKAELGALHARLARLQTPPADPSPTVAANLPWFDSARQVGDLSKVAVDSELALDEVAFVLEDSKQHPYLRYRMSMKVAAPYPVIRRFADDVSATMAHVDLDSISCSRSDIAVAPLSCELAFSAFFRRDTVGR